MNLAGWVKKVSGLPTISVGAWRGEKSAAGKLDEVIERLERGEFDLIAVGRALLQDHEWVHKVQARRLDELLDFDAAALQIYP